MSITQNNKFKKIESDLVPSTLHKQSAGENEPTSKWNIRILKDRTRSTVHSVPYRNMSLFNIDSIVGQAQSMLNAFPSKTGILNFMSARNIIKGRPNLDYNTMSLKLGSYIQLFEGTNNTQHRRSVGAVALNPQNEKAGYYFMFLITGRKLHGFIWTELPIAEWLITRFKELGK